MSTGFIQYILSDLRLSTDVWSLDKRSTLPDTAHSREIYISTNGLLPANYQQIRLTVSAFITVNVRSNGTV
jgi:hypothetical protein